MKKIKFFIDPINELGVWLNYISKKGYRLKSVKNFIYEFERTKHIYKYSANYIGAKSNKEVVNFLQFLKENNVKTFRAPLNQGNLFIFKFKLRPFIKGSARFANSFNNLNKEILIVENDNDEIQQLMTDNKDISKEYREIRNTYLGGLLMGIILSLYFIYDIFYKSINFGKILLALLLLIVIFIIIYLTISANNNYKKYKKEADIWEN